MSISKEQMLQALAHIKTPVTGESLVASGKLSDIIIQPQGQVMFSIAIKAPEASVWEPVCRQAEAAVKALGVSEVFVSLTEEIPAGSHQKASAQPKGPASRPSVKASQPVEGVRHIIAVASGKGGVGKSTTAANLALGLKSLGLKVGILDADIYGPSVPRLFGLTGKPAVNADNQLVPLDGYGLKVMSIGFLVDEEAAMIWRGPMVMSALTQLLRDVAWAELDVLVIDMPPGTGDAQLTIAQSTPLSGAIIVSTPQDLALIDARRGITMFKQVEIPILGLIENMATFICPHCGQSSHIFGHGGARDEAAKLNVPFLGEVPLNMTIRELSDAGRPVVIADPDGPHAKLYKDMAQQVWNSLSSGNNRNAPRIVIE
ncbi:Mrp/NBP35 family ATP-binding protein [Microvirga sp. W0021]|uniref:Iron-sulfur cluster carrier protein n=1 Tax=Hohaiivirga grylli TaxID=3133970 RepID=A0ABV0BJ84_9HYPH